MVVSAAFAAVMVGDLNGLGTRSRGLQGWWFGWGEVGDDGMMFSFFSYFFWGGQFRDWGVQFRDWGFLKGLGIWEVF